MLLTPMQLFEEVSTKRVFKKLGRKHGCCGEEKIPGLWEGMKMDLKTEQIHKS